MIVNRSCFRATTSDFGSYPFKFENVRIRMIFSKQRENFLGNTKIFFCDEKLNINEKHKKNSGEAQKKTQKTKEKTHERRTKNM